MRLLFLFLILLGSVHHSIADHFTDKKTKTDANLTGHVINKNTGERFVFLPIDNLPRLPGWYRNRQAGFSENSDRFRRLPFQV